MQDELSPVECAWIAGFFDGEGHIRIQKHSNRCRTMLLQVMISQATPDPLDWIQERCGGTLVSRRTDYRGGTRAQYNWQASSAVAEKFLRAVLPYLRNKRPEADLALQFRATFRPQHIAGGHKRMSEAEIANRERMASELKAMRKEKRAIADIAIPEKRRNLNG